MNGPLEGIVFMRFSNVRCGNTERCDGKFTKLVGLKADFL